jgi:IS30 family transposase
MPAKRELTMRQLRYMLRLHHDRVSARENGRTLGVARSAIQDNLRRAQASGISWPVPAELTGDILEQRPFTRAARRQACADAASRIGERWRARSSARA